MSMQAVYHAANQFHAQLIVDLLQSEGIVARIHGAYLAGAAGDLPLGGLIRVMVDEHDAERAETIVAQWEALPVPDDDELEEISGIKPTP
jgi:hypothetical protein